MTDTPEERIAAARARMAELADKFVDRSRDDLAAMRDALARVVAGAPGGLEALRHLAHRMAGTGATLGFEAVSDVALKIESLVEACAAGVPPDAGTRAELAAALDALGAELARPGSRQA